MCDEQRRSGRARLSQAVGHQLTLLVAASLVLAIAAAVRDPELIGAALLVALVSSGGFVPVGVFLASRGRSRATVSLAKALLDGLLAVASLCGTVWGTSEAGPVFSVLARAFGLCSVSALLVACGRR